jgi:hypothetical protein
MQPLSRVLSVSAIHAEATAGRDSRQYRPSWCQATKAGLRPEQALDGIEHGRVRGEIEGPAEVQVRLVHVRRTRGAAQARYQLFTVAACQRDLVGAEHAEAAEVAGRAVGVDLGVSEWGRHGASSGMRSSGAGE